VPQLVIDPDNIGKLGDDPPAITEIPSNVRKFGYIPNFRRCHSGDLILFRNRRPGPSCHWIRKAQSTFGDEDAQWTHAAVFLYDDLIVEAVPLHGVRPRSLCSDVPNRVLRVRRNNLQNEIDGYKIALRALSMLGASYNKSSTPKANRSRMSTALLVMPL